MTKGPKGNETKGQKDKCTKGQKDKRTEGQKYKKDQIILKKIFEVLCCILVGGEDNRAVTDLDFPHVTTKSWAYFGVFNFIRKKFG